MSRNEAWQDAELEHTTVQEKQLYPKQLAEAGSIKQGGSQRQLKQRRLCLKQHRDPYTPS